MKRTELLERVREAHTRLVNALDGLSEEEASRAGLNENWSVKDALAHISAWEVEGARIISEIQQGTWKPQQVNKELIDEFNARAVEERRARSMREVTDEFNTAHQEMERVLESLPEEVDEKSPAFEYARAITFRHHAHHAGQIEEWKKKIHGDG
ncbi:MAG TPA: DinB family protein [Pyrinomonadaceae bacterium]|nr:DinB family protein [Pyrinomonadaceae bacterium]